MTPNMRGAVSYFRSFREMLTARRPDVERLKARVDVRRLIIALSYRDWVVREAAARVLGEIGDSRAVESLIVALADKWWTVRRTAGWALAQMGPPAVAPLVAALQDSGWRVRQAAAGALGQIAADIQNRQQPEGDILLHSAVDPLLAALCQDGEWRVRVTAAEALGAIGAGLPDSASRVRLEEVLLATLHDEWRAVRNAASDSLARVGVPVANPLLAALGNSAWQAREGAAKALGQIGAHPDDPALQLRVARSLAATLHDRDTRVRQVGAKALGQLGATLERAERRQWVLDPLTAALKDDHGQVREVAAEALGLLGDAVAVGALMAVLEDPSEGVRQAAARALDRLAKTQGIHTGSSGT